VIATIAVSMPAIAGIESENRLDQAFEAMRRFKPMSKAEAEVGRLPERTRGHARRAAHGVVKRAGRNCGPRWRDCT
jgi:hypothetical protein